MNLEEKIRLVRSSLTLCGVPLIFDEVLEEIGGGDITREEFEQFKKEVARIDVDIYQALRQRYTKEEIDELIAGIEQFHAKCVDELPLVGETGIIYLIPSDDPEEQNVKDEYMWIIDGDDSDDSDDDGHFEKIGSTKIDLSDYYTKSDVDQMLATKQDVISDLNDIRSGAAAGATALQSESDPTVPAWAKTPNKPSYTASEVGALTSQDIKTLADTSLVGSGNVSLKTVGGQSLIGSGDIAIQASGVYQDPTTKEVYVEGIGGYDGTNPESSQSLEKYLEGVFRNISSHINDLTSRVETLEQ